jgi:thiol-disulfide isomerase/thioredoxin
VKGRRFWLAAAVVGTAAAAAGYGFNLWRGGGPGSDEGNPAAVRALLAARLTDLKGEVRTLDTWSGRVLVVNFWATWCAPCREEIPGFVRMQERYRARGLQFVGIAIDQPDKVAEFAREFSINYPLLVGGLDTMALMREAGNRAGVLPFTLVLDRRGTVASRHPGGLKEATLEAVIRPLLWLP